MQAAHFATEIKRAWSRFMCQHTRVPENTNCCHIQSLATMTRPQDSPDQPSAASGCSSNCSLVKHEMVKHDTPWSNTHLHSQWSAILLCKLFEYGIIAAQF
jgi:hypothetical protein